MILGMNGEVILHNTERKALLWLYNMCGLRTTEITKDRFAYLLAYMDENGSYSFYYHRDKLKDGKKRHLVIPNPELKIIQTRINRLLFDRTLAFYRFENSFGFSGGNCYQAVAIHEHQKSFLTYDLKDAFYQVKDFWVVHKFLREPVVQMPDGIWMKKKLFSFQVAYMVALLCTYTKGRTVYETKEDAFVAEYSLGIDNFITRYPDFKTCYVPPGAPSSPKIFDLAMRGMDVRLLQTAQRVEASYSRYADNIIFGFNTDKIPIKVSSLLVQECQHEVHKVKVVHSWQAPFRSLGYNISKDSISNTRKFKNSWRKALSHLEFCINNPKKVSAAQAEKAYLVANGFRGFVSPSNIPDKLWFKHFLLMEKYRYELFLGSYD